MPYQDAKSVFKRQTVNVYSVAVLVVLGFGSITYGYTASVIRQPSFIEYLHLDTRSDGTDLISTMNGLFQTGGVIGTLLLPTVADRYGRKWGCTVLVWSAILPIISGAIMCGSVNVGMFIVFRFFAGAGAFMILAAVPILINEIAPVNMRGALVDVHAVMFVVGYCVQTWMGFGFYFWKNGGSNTWRPTIALQCFWPLCLLVGLIFLPESPRWLVMQGRDKEAEGVLLKLNHHPSDPNDDLTKAELYQIRKQVAIDRTLVVFLVINNYGPTIYEQLGFSKVKQLLYPAAFQTFALGVNVMAMFVIDLFPRNKFISFGVLGCMSSLIVEAALVANFVSSNNSSALQAAVAMLFIFEIFYGFCLDGAQFAYLGEIFPNHLRAKGMCLRVATICLMNIFHDTKGLPLEEIATIFGDADEVAIYQREIEIDFATHTIKDHHEKYDMQNEMKSMDVSHVEAA
ncbi:hypothetical protein B7463_g10648, partial [Scytalidium lignicola]